MFVEEHDPVVLSVFIVQVKPVIVEACAMTLVHVALSTTISPSILLSKVAV